MPNHALAGYRSCFRFSAQRRVFNLFSALSKLSSSRCDVVGKQRPKLDEMNNHPIFTFISVIVAISQLIKTASGLEGGIKWNENIEIATGAGQRGPWQQNESKYDYVDDPSVVLYPGGDAAVVWVDQRQKDVLFQIYDRNGKPRPNEPLNVSRSPAIFSWLPRLSLSAAHPTEVYVLWQEIVFSGGSHGGEIFLPDRPMVARASANRLTFPTRYRATVKAESIKTFGTMGVWTWWLGRRARF